MSELQFQVVHASANDAGPFLENLVVEYGPVPLLGRFFATADAMLRAKGIFLHLASLEDAVATQAMNEESWHSFPPMLDPRLNGATSSTSYCLMGRDRMGAVVTVQAGRVFVGDDTLAAQFASGEFIYGSRAVGPFFAFSSSCAVADVIKPPFVYSGALWVHPNHRGSKLAGILVRLSRAYALARWNTSHTIACVSEEMASSPMPAIYGYSKVEPGITVSSLPDGSTWQGRLMWMDSIELLDDLRRFSVDRLPKIEHGIVLRAADKDN